MSIPDFQSMMLPFLEAVSDSQLHNNQEIEKAIANHFQLTKDDLHEMLHSGQQSKFSNRVAWAKAHLKKAGLIDAPSRGMNVLTEAGEKVLNEHPEKLDIAFLRQWTGKKYFAAIAEEENKLNLFANEVQTTNGTPEEVLESSYLTLREALASELLEHTMKCSPLFFEQLVVRLLVAMGYGGSLIEAGQAIGRSGDGGIDGIIKEDKLGLDVVCIQAKRWKETVGRPLVQAFAGSMEGMKARKGVLITTSVFSKDAREYVSKIERKIVLIDGEKLAELMIDHGIGVVTAHTYAIKKVDLDFFIEEDL